MQRTPTSEAQLLPEQNESFSASMWKWRGLSLSNRCVNGSHLLDMGIISLNRRLSRFPSSCFV